MKNLINSVHLIGHLGNTPEVKTFDSGKQMCQFSLATNESYKDKNGEWQDNTQWHRLVAWGPKVEKLAELTKGDKILIQGSLRHRQYDDKDGQRRYITEVQVYDFETLVKKTAVEPAF